MDKLKIDLNKKYYISEAKDLPKLQKDWIPFSNFIFFWIMLFLLFVL